MNKLDFPYIYRDHQKEACEFISKKIKNREIGFFEAPAGFGKTICSLTEALKHGKKILYLTQNYIGRDAPEKEIFKFNLNGHEFVVADLRGKKYLCSMFNGKSSVYDDCKQAKANEKCPYIKNTKDYDDKTGGNPYPKPEYLSFLKRVIHTQKNNPSFFLDKSFADWFKEECDKLTYCAYHAMQDLMKAADLILLDYNWITKGILYFMHKYIRIGNPEDTILLVDEADTLYERLFDGYKLTVSQFSRLENILLKIKKNNPSNTEIQELLDKTILYKERVNLLIQNIKNEEIISPEEIADCINLEENLKATKKIKIIQEDLDTIQTRINEIAKDLLQDEDVTTSNPSLFFEHLLEYNDKKQLIYKKISDAGRYSIELRSYDIQDIIIPYSGEDGGKNIAGVLNEFYSTILFSATFGSPEIYAKEMGIDCNINQVYAVPGENIKVKVYIKKNSSSITKNYYNRGYTRFDSPYTDIPFILKLLKIYPKILIGEHSEATLDLFMQRWSEITDNKYNIIDTKKYVDNNPINENVNVVIGSMFWREARSNNYFGDFPIIVIRGIPYSFEDFFEKKRRKYLIEKYGDIDTNKILARNSVSRAIQQAGRITRNPYKEHRIIVLCDFRYANSKYLTLLPKYYRKSIEIHNTGKDIIESIDHLGGIS